MTDSFYMPVYQGDFFEEKKPSTSSGTAFPYYRFKKTPIRRDPLMTRRSASLNSGFSCQTTRVIIAWRKKNHHTSP